MAAGNAPELATVRIAVGGKASLYYLPLTIAQQRGYFRDEGLNVEIDDFAGGSKALQSVIGGSADVVSGAFESVIQVQSKGQHLRAFVLQGSAPQMVLAVASGKAAQFKSYRDLKGYRIGVSAPGSSTNMLVNYVLAGAGVKPGEVSIIGVGTAAGAVAALRAGNIDAISNVEPAITMLQQHGDIKIVADTRTGQGTEAVFGGPMPAAALYAPEAFLKKNPNTAQALANAMVRALKWLHQAQAPDIADAVPPAYLLGDRDLYLAAFSHTRDAYSRDGMIPPQGVATAFRVVGSVYPDVNPGRMDESYTNTFAIKANQKYR
jgi:NitT/TauT family transport system substrate-binding protein